MSFCKPSSEPIEKVLPECGLVKIEHFIHSSTTHTGSTQSFLCGCTTNSTNTTTLSANTSECGSSNSNECSSPNLLVSSPDIEVIAEEFVENDLQSKCLVHQPVLSFDFNAIYVCLVGLPVIAIVSVFCIGIAADREELFDYDWNNCGKTFLPSVSRIINLPTERIVWNFFTLLHASFWPLSLVQIYLKHKNKRQSRLKLFSFGTELMLLSGFTELAFMILLSVVGERESPTLHVVFFVGFILSCAVNFLLISLYSTKHRAIRLTLTALLYFLNLVISISFYLNLSYCTNHSYTVFAVSEYATRNFNRLAKKEVKVLRIIETPSGKFMRYGLRTFSSNIDRFFGELHVDKLNKPLRHMRCLNISVEYANLSDQLLLELQRCIRNSMQTLELNYSSLVCSFQVFAKCLKQWDVWRMVVNECKFSGEENWDYLFRSDPQLTDCSFNFNSLTILDITDQTIIDYWCAKLCWPRTFLLKNVRCPSITSASVVLLIEKVIQTKPHISGNLMWNFGAAFSFSRHDFDQKLGQLQDLVVDYKLLSSGTLFVKFKIKPSSKTFLHLRMKFLN